MVGNPYPKGPGWSQEDLTLTGRTSEVNSCRPYKMETSWDQQHLLRGCFSCTSSLLLCLFSAITFTLMWWISPEFCILPVHLLTTYNHYKAGSHFETHIKICFIRPQFPSSAPYLPILTSLCLIVQEKKMRMLVRKQIKMMKIIFPLHILRPFSRVSENDFPLESHTLESGT